ncbi:MAG: hypothetical protein AAFN08_05020, partial [Cyanobacteria bacterium J06559_3]
SAFFWLVRSRLLYSAFLAIASTLCSNIPLETHQPITVRYGLGHSSQLPDSKRKIPNSLCDR